ncbi:phosphohistidine phosphatase SixA [Haloferula sp.]|uniref:phosphohistidine phosphatase SixA n=1 Tax=Haloferula sp. TaxID=2497595 RepID=UPI003C78B9C2
MKLYFLRHADAATQAANDDDRAISKKGIKQCKRVAKFCRSQGIEPEVILVSPLLRAQQTAKPVAAALKVPLETVPWLVYETETEEVLKQLAARSDNSSVMIVGHQPDFGLLAEALLGSEEGTIRVRKGSLILLNVSEFRRGGALLEWSIPAQLI